jgi:hypothetical protein
VVGKAVDVASAVVPQVSQAALSGLAGAKRTKPARRR